MYIMIYTIILTYQRNVITIIEYKAGDHLLHKFVYKQHLHQNTN